jgi:UDP-N-acetylmuramoylalanine--D-glutamate ligase
VSGAFTAALVEGTDVRCVLRSPGLTPAAVAPVDSGSRNRGEVSGELGLFAQALADLKTDTGYAPRVLAVTGTNGKTTVTALDRPAGRARRQGGGRGRQHRPHAARHAGSKARCRGLPEVWVLELSSFQLDGHTNVDNFEPTAATVLNLTQDHLDWHGSMDAYAAAKARIFGSSGLMVLNREDPLVMAMLPEPVRLKGGSSSNART